ncbi:putative bifunctional diguanylate cyclase/phosphodiesterase [Vibrio sp. V39_P1S14PM300]|uniref:putative bifunctional diguanylate cyclase/phosphodiesterase n=1 Tax=Vibrio sp. V39_P1S14PM300 TaxID=1938690 RepID=UPI0013725249|nr:EAL domain-containing protein [Vibrio sp. V39_P1S14PM300]NAX20752.1 EAL domain-containing protein [Vibrio sp. V39_P1S14PM300]
MSHNPLISLHADAITQALHQLRTLLSGQCALLSGHMPHQPVLGDSLHVTAELASWYPGQSELYHCQHSGVTLAPIWQDASTLIALLAVKSAHPQTAWLTRTAADSLTHTLGQSLTLPTLQQFINSLDDHAWVKDPNGIYIMGNLAIEQAWGRTLSEIVGASDHQLFSPHLARKFIASDHKVMEHGKAMTVDECCDQGTRGDKQWYETIKAPIFDHQQRLVGILGMTRNATQRKQVENQLSIATKIFSNSHEGVVITDADGKIVEINAAFSDITGYPPQDVIGHNPRLLQSGHHDRAFYRDMWAQLKRDGRWKGEFINRRKDGSVYPQLATISAVYDEYKQLMNYICVFEDISLYKEHEEKIEQMAYFDPLTDLPNRTHLIQLLDEQIVASRESGRSFATLVLDVDHFKHVNDSLGHFSGDKILSELATRLKAHLRHQDHIARIGGDEFVIILSDLDSTADLSLMMQRLFSSFQQTFSPHEGAALRLSTSIGVAMFPCDGDDGETLLKNADTAMYQAKKNGRNGYAFYTPELTDVAVSHVRLQSALHEALELGQFSLAYQPQYQLADARLTGFEALIRWQHPELGAISPAQFIPIAEKSGLMQAMGKWVLTTACRQGKTWLDKGYEFGKLAVNVSAIQLQQSEFTERLEAILHDTGFPANRLEIEITEGLLMEDQEQAIRYLDQVRQLGVEIALDDFGTGYSSLSYLKGLPLHKLKVDRSFVSDVPDDTDSNAIVNAIIAMGHTLGLKVIAEGIENSQQQDYLLRQGCCYGQGYHLGRPMDAEAATTLLKGA